MSRYAAAEGDISLLKDGVSALSGMLGKCMKLIGCLSKALVWACGSSKQMGFKRRPGFVVGRVLKSCKVALKGPGFCVGPKVIKPNATRVADLGSETAFSSETGSEWVSGPVSCPSLGLPQSLPEAAALALPNVSSLPESTSELSSGLRLARSFTGGFEDAPSGATVTADPTS